MKWIVEVGHYRRVAPSESCPFDAVWCQTRKCVYCIRVYLLSSICATNVWTLPLGHSRLHLNTMWILFLFFIIAQLQHSLGSHDIPPVMNVNTWCYVCECEKSIVASVTLCRHVKQTIDQRLFEIIAKHLPISLDAQAISLFFDLRWMKRSTNNARNDVSSING